MLYICNPKSLILILKTDVMKKILVILMAALFVLPMTGVSASFSGKSDVDSLKTIEEDNRLFEIMQIKSQSSVKQLLKAKSKWMKQLGKVMKKRSKLTTKKLEKDGWRSYGTNKELDHSLLCHYQLLYDGGMMGLDYVREFVGFGYSDSATEAKKMAFYGVCDLFAQDVKSEIIWRDNYSYNGELVYPAIKVIYQKTRSDSPYRKINIYAVSKVAGGPEFLGSVINTIGFIIHWNKSIKSFRQTK